MSANTGVLFLFFSDLVGSHSFLSFCFSVFSVVQWIFSPLKAFCLGYKRLASYFGQASILILIFPSPPMSMHALLWTN